jgi:hypothetical protein
MFPAGWFKSSAMCRFIGIANAAMVTARKSRYGKSLISSEGNRGQLDHGTRIRLPDFLMSLIQAS